MKQWRRRARRWKQIAKTCGQQWYDLSIKMTAERDARLNEVEELRHELVKSATELARVQEVCDALLAWQKGLPSDGPGIVTPGEEP